MLSDKLNVEIFFKKNTSVCKKVKTIKTGMLCKELCVV